MKLWLYGKQRLNYRSYKVTVCFVSSLALLGAVRAVQQTNLLPKKYFLAATLVGFLVCAGLWRAALKKRKGARSPVKVFTVISVLFIMSALYITHLASTTHAFFDRVQQQNQNSYSTYNVLVKKIRRQELQDSLTRRAATLSSRPLGKISTEDLPKGFVVASETSYENLSELTDVFVKDQADVMVLQSSYVELLKENFAAVYEQVEIVQDFTVRDATRNSASNAGDVTKPFVVFISGIDTYGAVQTVSRSDVNILAVVNPTKHTVLLVNTPRDYYVQLHGTNGARDKLTHAGLYGVDQSVATLEDLFRTHIDYYVRLNFSSFERIIGTIGNIDVISDQAFSSYTYSYSEGYNNLNGAQALEFARARYPFTDGDKTRGKNQQRVVQAVIKKLSVGKLVQNYSGILEVLGDSLQTNMSSKSIAMLLQNQIADTPNWNVESVSVDGYGTFAPTYSTGAVELSVLEPDAASVATATEKIAEALKN
jgi:LCP family protein required for cell wall assembly